MQPFLVRGPLDLVVLAPHVLGFRPEESVVLLSLGPGAGLHARVDLPSSPAEGRELAELLVAVTRERDVEAVALLLFAADAGQAVTLAEVLTAALRAAGVEVVDRLRVHAERFHRLDVPGDPGTPYDLSSHPLTVRRVFAGLRVHGSREELAATLRPGPHDDVEAVDRHARSIARRLAMAGSRPGGVAAEHRRQARWVRRRVDRWAEDGEPLADEDVGRVAALMAVAAVRDAVWVDLDRSRAADRLELWCDLLRRVPDDLVPGVAAVTAFVAWLTGDGAVAWCALERCAEVTGGAEPDIVLVGLVTRLLAEAVSPDAWTPMLGSALPVLRPDPEVEA